MNPHSTSLSPFLKTLPKIPYGIAYIASVLEQNNIDVSIWDRNVNEEDPKVVLQKEQADIVGFSVMTGDCILDSVKLSKIVREDCPETIIVWGGYHPTLLPEQTVKEDFIDYVVRGDGEYALTELALGKTQEKNIIDGISIKNLDELPFPAWHLFDMEQYIRNTAFNERQLNLNTSRGCPYDCSFCCEPAFHKRRWRANSPRRVIGMIKHLKAEYRVNHIDFRESLFTADLRRLEEICDLLIKEKLNITWSCPARIMNWNKQFLKRLKKSGCRSFEFGVETGSPRLLRLINKRFTLEQVYDTFEKCNEVGIVPRLNLIVGLPTETREDLQMTLELRDKLKTGIVSIWTFIPFPKTKLTEILLNQSKFTPPENLLDWGGYFDILPSFGDVDKETLSDICRQTRERNRKITRNLSVQRLLRNPKEILNFIRGMYSRRRAVISH